MAARWAGTMLIDAVLLAALGLTLGCAPSQEAPPPPAAEPPPPPAVEPLSAEDFESGDTGDLRTHSSDGPEAGAEDGDAVEGAPSGEGTDGDG